LPFYFYGALLIGYAAVLMVPIQLNRPSVGPDAPHYLHFSPQGRVTYLLTQIRRGNAFFSLFPCPPGRLEVLPTSPNALPITPSGIRNEASSGHVLCLFVLPIPMHLSPRSCGAYERFIFTFVFSTAYDGVFLSQLSKNERAC
jgi:hypothetical protein